jgi:hypothetical protein
MKIFCFLNWRAHRQTHTQRDREWKTVIKLSRKTTGSKKTDLKITAQHDICFVIRLCWTLSPRQHDKNKMLCTCFGVAKTKKPSELGECHLGESVAKIESFPSLCALNARNYCSYIVVSSTSFSLCHDKKGKWNCVKINEKKRAESRSVYVNMLSVAWGSERSKICTLCKIEKEA